MTEHDTGDDTDDDTGDIRDLLDGAAPSSPDLTSGERAVAVATRGRAARRRTRSVLAASVVLVAGVAVGVPLALRDGPTTSDLASTTGTDAPTPSSSPTPEPLPEAAACPAAPVDTATVGSIDSIPDGAVSARLCPATYDPATDAPPLGDLPKDALVGDPAARFVGTLASYPPYESEPECAYTDYAPAPWSLQISYADGSTVTVGTTLRVCAAIEIDGVPRSAELILRRFGAAVAAHAAQQGGVDAPSCPRTGTGLRTLVAAPDTYAGTFEDFAPTAARVCYGRDPMGPVEYADDRGPVSADDLAVLWDDVAARRTPEPSQPGMCIDSGPTRLLVVADAAGAQVTLSDSSCTGEFSSAFGYWDPRGRTAEILEQALGGRRGRS